MQLLSGSLDAALAGAAFSVAADLGLPVAFVGVGEGVDDLQPFDARAFARSLVGLSEPMR